MSPFRRSDEGAAGVRGAPVTDDPRPNPRWSDLGVRAASGLVLVAAAILTTEIGGALFVVFWSFAALAVFWEWQRLTGAKQSSLQMMLGLAALVAIAVLAAIEVRGAWAALGAAALLQARLAADGKRTWAVAGTIYAGLFVVAVIALRMSSPFGSRAIVWLFAVVWSTDVFAYMGGRLIGGPKLWARVSPSKTWSGTITGVVAGAAVGTFAAVRDLPLPSAALPVFVLSLVAAVLSQAGDAFESAVKRRFGVKDSSHLIPGHGGFMDRLDGFIVAAVFALGVGLVRNPASVAAGLFYWA